MGEARVEATFGGVLADRRRRGFVGRGSQVELFRSAVESGEPPFSVLYVHGPAGIGKTSLLDRFAEQAVDAGARLIRVDGRNIDPTPEAVTGALPDAHSHSGSRLVLLLDTYERLAPLDTWVHARFLPRLPVDTIVVIAGRDRPGLARRPRHARPAAGGVAAQPRPR